MGYLLQKYKQPAIDRTYSHDKFISALTIFAFLDEILLFIF